MGCGPFDNHCRNGVNIGVEIGTPGMVQPGYPIAQPGYPMGPGYQQDRVQMDAMRIARELQDPRMAPMAMQEIRNEVYALPPREAERFAHALDRDTNGYSPLHERPQMVQTPYGPRATGNEVLTMTNPYGREDVVKLIPHERMVGVPPVVGGPPVIGVPGVGVGIDLHFGGKR